MDARSSFLPGEGTWWGTYVRIHDPAGGGNNRSTDAFHLVRARAPSPEGLESGAFHRLAGTAASDAWRIDHRLSSASPELERCTLWLDPELVLDDGRLYFLALCVLYGGGARVPAESFYGVFELPIEGVVAGAPRWIGRIADAADAARLGGHELSKADVARAGDGSLLFIVSPVRQGPRFEEYSGCYVLTIESLDPPRLRRHPDGAPMVRAIVRSSDSIPTSGSCAYHAQSETGIVVTRRVLDPARGQLVWSLHATGFHP